MVQSIFTTYFEYDQKMKKIQYCVQRLRIHYGKLVDKNELKFTEEGCLVINRKKENSPSIEEEYWIFKYHTDWLLNLP